MSSQPFNVSRMPVAAVDGPRIVVPVPRPAPETTASLIHGLRVECVATDTAAVVTVTGEIDSGTVGVLSEQLRAGLRLIGRSTAMVVDLRAVRFFGAAGTTVLLTTSDYCRRRGAALYIVATQYAVLRRLEITGLADTLTVVPALPGGLAERLGATWTSQADGDDSTRTEVALVRVDHARRGREHDRGTIVGSSRTSPALCVVAEASQTISGGSKVPRATDEEQSVPSSSRHMWMRKSVVAVQDLFSHGRRGRHRRSSSVSRLARRTPRESNAAAGTVP